MNRAAHTIPPDELIGHADFVRRIAFAILRDDADADDAAQETLAKAMEDGPRVPAARRSWLAAVVASVARGFQRAGSRRHARERRASRPEATSAAIDDAVRAETLRLVADAGASLEPPLREVVLRRHYDGLPPREIAAALGVPVESVKSRLQRAHARLRERLDVLRPGGSDRRARALAAFAGIRFDEAASSTAAM